MNCMKTDNAEPCLQRERARNAIGSQINWEVGSITILAVATGIALAGFATAQSQDGDNCCSGTIDCEPSFTSQLPPDCVELRDQAYREEQERYYARWQENSEREQAMLQNSEQIHHDAISRD